jgi:hypothetical protein
MLVYQRVIICNLIKVIDKFLWIDSKISPSTAEVPI